VVHEAAQDPACQAVDGCCQRLCEKSYCACAARFGWATLTLAHPGCHLFGLSICPAGQQRLYDAQKTCTWEGLTAENSGARGLQRLRAANPNSFDLWIERHWGVNIQTFEATGWRPYGIFGASRDALTQHHKGGYSRLAAHMERVGQTDMMAGHYMERSWRVIFSVGPAGGALPAPLADEEEEEEEEGEGGENALRGITREEVEKEEAAAKAKAEAAAAAAAAAALQVKEAALAAAAAAAAAERAAHEAAAAAAAEAARATAAAAEAAAALEGEAAAEAASGGATVVGGEAEEDESAASELNTFLDDPMVAVRAAVSGA